MVPDKSLVNFTFILQAHEYEYFYGNDGCTCGIKFRKYTENKMPYYRHVAEMLIECLADMAATQSLYETSNSDYSPTAQ